MTLFFDPEKWKFRSSKKEIFHNNFCAPGASITLTDKKGFGKPWPESGAGQDRDNKETKAVCDAGARRTRGPHFPPKREEQEPGYPSTISSAAAKPWEALDLDWWPEWRELEVIAASAVVWWHNLSFPMNNVLISDGVPKKVAVAFLRGFVAGLITLVWFDEPGQRNSLTTTVTPV